MSYDCCRRITLDKKNNKIKCCVASSNVFPKTYGTYEFCKNEDDTFEDKLMFLYASMQSGDIQITTINDNTEKFEYAMCKVREYHRANNIDSYDDLYEKKGEVYRNKIFGFANIKRSQNEDEYKRNSEDWESYGNWKKTQDEKHIKEIEDKFYKEAIWEVYGESFKIWKQALEEKFNGEYRVRFDKNYEVLSIGKYDRGYSRFSYTSYLGQGMKMSYKKAYILKYDMGANRDLEIIKV